MKFLIAVCVLVLFALTAGKSDADRGCAYIDGECSEYCEEGTHAYNTNCGPLTPEATCEQPHPVEQEGDVCDYSACHCDPPTVRDSVSGKCVPLDKCPNIDKKSKNCTS